MMDRLRRSHDRLAAEVLAAIEGRLTIFHIVGFLLGLIALFVAPIAAPHPGLGWKVLIAIVAAILGYWAGFVAAMLAAGAALALLHLLGVRPGPGEADDPGKTP